MVEPPLSRESWSTNSEAPVITTAAIDCLSLIQVSLTLPLMANTNQLHLPELQGLTEAQTQKHRSCQYEYPYCKKVKFHFGKQNSWMATRSRIVTITVRFFSSVFSTIILEPREKWRFPPDRLWSWEWQHWLTVPPDDQSLTNPEKRIYHTSTHPCTHSPGSLLTWTNVKAAWYVSLGYFLNLVPQSRACAQASGHFNLHSYIHRWLYKTLT